MGRGDRSNKFYCGDNLEVLRMYIEDETIDLIYLDPPFQSGKDYNLLFVPRDRDARPVAQVKAFEDTWDWNEVARAAYDEVVAKGLPISLALETFHRFIPTSRMLAYLSMMSLRLFELHRVLKPTGSLYLHCDPSASHYLKIMLDAIFGPGCFRNEVIWKRSSAHSNSKRFSPVHDTLLFYTKSDRYTWNQNAISLPLPKKTADAWYNNIEAGTGRRFNRADLTGAGPRAGESGRPWRGIDPTRKNRHWAIPRFVKDIVGDKTTHDALDALDAAGRIHWPKKKGGMPMLKRYIDEARGIPALDVLTHISPLNNVDAERLGYPTQKPVALLEALIKSSSNENDVVLDPFCGCGTTIHAAHRHRRRWIGIDISARARELIDKRLGEEFGEIALKSYDVQAEPQDVESAALLAEDDRFEFQRWALSLIGVRREDMKKGADGGIDGILPFQETIGASVQRIIFSVKSGHHKVSDVRDLRGVLDREKAAIGVVITLKEPTKPMIKEAAEAGSYTTKYGERFPRIQILTVGELLDGAHIKAPLAAVRKGPKRAVTPQKEFSFMQGPSAADRR